MRTITAVSKRYLKRSCGLSIRMKLPCRHICFLTKTYNIEMFDLKWLNLYQFSFCRPGYENLTEFFRKMEKQEYQRSKKILNAIPIEDSVIGKSLLLILIFDTTESERKEQSKDLCFCSWVCQFYGFR